MARLLLLLLCFAFQQIPRIECGADCDQWKCKSKNVTDCPVLCDGYIDCSDKEDEKFCYTACGKETVACKGPGPKYWPCVSASLVCDGKPDCKGGEDENKDICHQDLCREEQYKCSNSRCINMDFKCDGHTDCDDEVDEKECGGDDKNIAYKRPTSQSSTVSGLTSDKAVDGDKSTNNFGNCAQTTYEVGWWAVKLDRIYTVSRVDIFGKEEHLKYIKTQVIMTDVYTNSKWTEIDYGVQWNCHFITTITKDREKPCPEKLVGNFVRIIHTQRLYLTLCEVLVYGKPTPPYKLDDIISTYKPVKSKSQRWDGAPEKAVDGKYLFVYTQGSCFHSQDTSTTNEWWAVNLEDVYVVTRMIIYGRSDCCFDRLGDVDVDVILLEPNVAAWGFDKGIVSRCYYQASGTQGFYTLCPPNLIGNYVRLRMRNRRILSFCEVFVFGMKYNAELFLYGRNIATNKATTASSISSASHASSLAVDGRVYPLLADQANNCFLSENGVNEWWAVDLGAVYKVHMVVVYGRDENKDTSLDDFDIEIIDIYCSPKDFKIFDKKPKVTNCHEQNEATVYLITKCEKSPQGQFVRIRNRDKSVRNIALCEVEIYGTLAAPFKFGRKDNFQCGDLTCIPTEHKCDGYLDCTDGEDELDCPCSDDQFQCNNKSLVIHQFRTCDGIKDCKAGEDEADCIDCGVNYKCKDGSCVPANAVCQETSPCKDETINIECFFQCLNGQRIKHYKICNEEKDCEGGEDEKFCSKRCGHGMRSCYNRNDTDTCQNETNFFCVPFFKLCDMKQDCPLAEDELSCNTSFVLPTTATASTTTKTTTTEATTTTPTTTESTTTTTETTITATTTTTSPTTTVDIKCNMQSSAPITSRLTSVLVVIILALGCSCQIMT